jgi:hypothetical protein
MHDGGIIQKINSLVLSKWFKTPNGKMPWMKK